MLSNLSINTNDTAFASKLWHHCLFINLWYEIFYNNNYLPPDVNTTPGTK